MKTVSEWPSSRWWLEVSYGGWPLGHVYVRNCWDLSHHITRGPALSTMSLRKQRPNVNPKANGQLRPQQQRPNKNGTRVEDRIKQRMSMRYADISAPLDFQGIPDVPAIPIHLRPGIPGSNRGEYENGVQRERQQKDPRRDLKAMEQDDFDPEACKFQVLVRRYYTI